MINIAIDGPCGAGKSTISKLIAKKLSYTYLDTGAMYRAVGLYAFENNFDLVSGDIESLLTQIKLDIAYNKSIDKTVILVNGKDVSDKIREHFVSKLASEISKIKEVRSFLVQMQRKIANGKNVVLDGRDIGTQVLPNATYKFFLTADPKERAKRRFDELVAKGEIVNFDDILNDVNERDSNDINRKESPLKQASDAILIDSSGKDIQQVVLEILSYIH
ncbi:MAG: (d)CMP kinase [Clostridia bacterium]